MKLITEDVHMICDHKLGVVEIVPTQGLVTINGRRVLVAINPEGRPIKGCPFTTIVTKPCTATLKVDSGYSSLIRINGRAVCLSVTGLTDGTPPGTVKYWVHSPGQDFVNAEA